jgi:hypothetical protein
VKYLSDQHWKETYKPELIKEEEISSSLDGGAFFICGCDKIGDIFRVSRNLHLQAAQSLLYWVADTTPTSKSTQLQ